MRAYKFKLFNNKKKARVLEGELRFFCEIYNHSLALIKEHYKLFGKNPTKFKLQKHLVKLMKGDKFYWDALGYSQAIQEITDRIYKSYDRFFHWAKTRTGPKMLPPKFKSFNKYKSYTLKQAGYKLDEGKGKIKIGPNWYRYNKSRNIQGKIKTVTVKRDGVGDWYVIFACDVGENFVPEKPILSATSKIEGYDFGLKVFLTSSEEKEYHLSQFFKRELNVLRQKSRQLSSKVYGSKNRSKAKKSLARTHRRIANMRMDEHFKLARKLLEQSNIVVLETLNMNAMKRIWGRKISDLAFSQFVRILEGKALENEEKGHKQVVKISRWFPSSKTCSKCGAIKENLSLKERVFVCKCGNTMSREKNAAINIKNEGASSSGLGGVRPDSVLAPSV